MDSDRSMIEIKFWADIQRLIHSGVDTLDYIITIESTGYDFSKLNLMFISLTPCFICLTNYITILISKQSHLQEKDSFI